MSVLYRKRGVDVVTCGACSKSYPVLMLEGMMCVFVNLVVELNNGWDDVLSDCNLQKQLDNLVASKSVSNADLGKYYLYIRKSKFS